MSKIYDKDSRYDISITRSDDVYMIKVTDCLSERDFAMTSSHLDEITVAHAMYRVTDGLHECLMTAMVECKNA